MDQTQVYKAWPSFFLLEGTTDHQQTNNNIPSHFSSFSYLISSLNYFSLFNIYMVEKYIYIFIWLEWNQKAKALMGPRPPNSSSSPCRCFYLFISFCVLPNLKKCSIYTIISFHPFSSLLLFIQSFDSTYLNRILN